MTPRSVSENMTNQMSGFAHHAELAHVLKIALIMLMQLKVVLSPLIVAVQHA